MEVYDVAGKKVHQKSIFLVENQTSIETTITGLPKAIYLFNLIQGNAKHTFQLNL